MLFVVKVVDDYLFRSLLWGRSRCYKIDIHIYGLWLWCCDILSGVVIRLFFPCVQVFPE